jgi:hypothetical protein
MTPPQLANHIKKLGGSCKFSDALLLILRDELKLMDEEAHENQQQHWLGWLKSYNTSGHYRRKNVNVMDAKIVYNRIVCPPMLLWLPEASRVSKPLIKEAFIAASVEAKIALPARCKAIRKIIPWEKVEEKLLETGTAKAKRARA